MGTILLFVVSCLGPGTKGLFLTWSCCLNLFWIVVGASRAGKSQSRKQFITKPLEYILSNGRVQIPDFEVSKFMRAGKCNLTSLPSQVNDLVCIISILTLIYITQALRISCWLQVAMV